MVERELAVLRLLESDWEVESLLLSPSRAARLTQRPEFLRRSPRPAVYVGPRELLSQVVGYDFHRGCAATAHRPPARPLPADPGPVLVAGLGLSDPANLGALLRNARSLGAGGVLCDPHGADPLDPRAIRASMGSCFSLPWWTPPDFEGELRALQARGYALVAATLGPQARPLRQVTPPPRFVLLLGNEGHGLGAAWSALADLEVTIPMAPGADSLNVAAASAVLLYGLLHVSSVD